MSCHPYPQRKRGKDWRSPRHAGSAETTVGRRFYQAVGLPRATGVFDFLCVCSRELLLVTSVVSGASLLTASLFSRLSGVPVRVSLSCLSGLHRDLFSPSLSFQPACLRKRLVMAAGPSSLTQAPGSAGVGGLAGGWSCWAVPGHPRLGVCRAVSGISKARPLEAPGSLLPPPLPCPHWGWAPGAWTGAPLACRDPGPPRPGLWGPRVGSSLLPGPTLSPPALSRDIAITSPATSPLSNAPSRCGV